MPSAKLSEADAVQCAECGDVDGLARWCKQMGGPVAVNMTLSSGSTLLHVASESGQLGAVEFFLNAGASLMVDSDGQTAIHCAALHGHANILAALIEHFNPEARDEVNRRDTYMMTPLHLAVEGGHVDATSYLCSLPHLAARSRRDSVHFLALRHGHGRVLKVLEEHTPNVQESPSTAPAVRSDAPAKHIPLAEAVFEVHNVPSAKEPVRDAENAADASVPKPAHPTKLRWRLPGGRLLERLGRPRRRSHASQRAERPSRVFGWARASRSAA